MNKAMVIGLGDVGQHVLELLARTPGLAEVIAVSLERDEGLRLVYRARVGAAHMGFFPRIEFVELDLNNTEATADLFRSIEPDVVVNTAAIQSWWVIEKDLPREVFQKLDAAGYGPWIPLHLTLTYKLMKAIKMARTNTHVVSAPFPDAVNAILGKVGLAPMVGMGNIDLMIPGIQKVVADKLKVPMRSVSVYAVAAHFVNDSLSTYGTTGGAPYFLKIIAGDKNVTDKFDLDKLLVEAHAHYPQGRDDHFITASSGVKNALAILNDAGILTHAPGPAGLPGGYPIQLSAKKAKVVLPDGITKEEAVRINEEGLKYDGIEKIENDGTVLFTEKAVGIMKELLGYDCERLKLVECEENARRLKSLYTSFIQKYRVT
jgi:hypothetical protein